MKKRKFFYGWVIVFASILITASGIGAVNSTNSVLVKPICDELGFSRGEFTLHRTIIALVGAFMLPLFGNMIRKIGVKKVLLISSVAISVITFSYSFATQIWHFYLIAFLNGLFFNGVNFMTIGMLVSNWFDDKRGFATGLAYCGSGLGAALMVPIVTQIAEQFGWQWVYRSIGVIVLAVLVPTILFIVKESPEKMGLTPYRNTENTETNLAGEIDASGLTLKQAFKTPAFWLMVLSFFLLSMMASGPNTHTVPYLTDIGYSAVFAASVMSLIMIMLTVGKIALGFFFDRFGALSGSIFLSACCILFPLLALAMASNNPAAPWVYAVFYGMASAGFSVPVTVLVAKYFGNKDFSAIFSLCTMVTTFGSSVAAPAIGAIYDGTGSYQPAWFMLLGFGILILICMVGANITSRRIKKA